MTEELSPRELFTGAINNTGLVSVLLAGESGTGKTFTIESVLHEMRLKRRSIPALFAPDTVEAWQNLLGEMVRKKVKVLVVDHIEDMPQKAQTALFHVFSSHHGELCRFPDSNFDLRMVFTTVKTIRELRSSADIIMPHVYDRMSQLIIRFKNLRETENLWARFKEVWAAMNFEKFNQVPKEGGLKNWINNNAEKMNGNYRDLEKLAIRWHNRRLLGFSEDGILSHIIKEYEELGFGAEPESDGAVFHIPSPNGKTVNWETIEADFKRYLKEWAVKETGTVSGASSVLGVSVRTLERWK